MLRGLFGEPKPGASASDGQAGPARSQASLETVIGTHTRIVGMLRSEGGIQIGGTFEGDISALGAVLVMEGGHLQGDLICQTAVVGGVVEGNITARRVTVLGSGRVLGDLRMEQLSTEEGAYIQGIITLETQVDIAALLAAPEAAKSELGESPSH